VGRRGVGGRIGRSLSVVSVTAMESMNSVHLYSAAPRLRYLLYCSGARVVLLSYKKARHWAVYGKRSVCAVVRHRNYLRLRVVVWVR
jgi:hypothetical protein